MAELHVLSEWHGPGEENAARRLAAELPAGWHVIAGRQLPDQRGAIDLDLVVVGVNGVHLCEEKSWGPNVVVGEVTWYSNGQARPNALNQCSHAARVLAGRLRTKVAGWEAAGKHLPRGARAVTAHVVMSADPLVLTGAAELGEDVVLRLGEAAEVLTRRDAALGGALAMLRPKLMAYLLGLAARPRPDHATQILQYTVLGRPQVEGHVTVFPAANPAGNPVGLYAVPIANAADPEQMRRLATREHDALAALASKERTWRVQDWFDWEGYRVTPVVVDMDGTSLGKLASERRPEPDVDGRVSEDIGTAVVNDAFTALAAVHGEGIMHRALQLRSVEVTEHNRVRFRDFSRSRLPATTTVAPALDDEHRSTPFRPPGASLGFFQPRDDVYSLALCLVQWLHGDAADEPDHDLARRRAEAYPGVGATLARCLAPAPADRLDAADAAAATARRAGPPAPQEQEIVPGALIGGQFRVQRKLGEGAWAVSWLAMDEELDKLRVLKHLRPERVSADQAKAEFRHADAINSPHCARPYQVLSNPEPGVLVQQYIEGSTLRERAEQLRAAGHRFEPDQVRRIAVGMLRGLADAHDQHVYHRDVSPSNVVVRPDGHAVLIDFGLAAATETAQSVVGSPPFTAPEVWTRRLWSPSADIYSAAATVLTAVLGRYPYRGPGVDQRDIVPASVDDQAHYGRALLATLYEALDPEPRARPGDARVFADRIQQARDTVVVTGHRVTNPTVDELRGLYRGSGIGNAGNRGLDDPFAQETYVPTLLDTGLLPAILGRTLDVVVLSGNPGDGKTSFLVQVGDALDRAGAGGIADPAGWRKTLDGHTFVAVYDASESHGDLTSDALLHAALDPAPGEDPTRRTVLLAANDGRIADFFTGNEDLYPEVSEQMARQQRTPAAPGTRIVLVDLKRRALAHPQGAGLGLDILASVTAPERWAACEVCLARDTCPIRANAALLSTRPARHGVWTLLLTSHLRRRRRATVRDVRSAIGFLVTGNRSCADVHAEHERGQDPGAGTDRRTADLAFADGSGDYLVQEWSELDPATLSTPGAARAARSDPQVIPDLSAVDFGVMAGLKRRLFFGEWSAPGAEHEVRSYRYLLDYLDALDDPEDARTKLLRGLSRVLAYVGYDDTHVALRDRTFDDPAVRAIVVVKELPADEFTLRADTAASAYVESFPDQLMLQHDPSRARLRITLDTAELLLRAAAGEVLGDPASAALRQEIQGFGNQLRLQPASSVRIVDGAGRSVGAAVQGDRIVRVP